jgi:xanthine dehydrogenase small subunit
MANDQVVVWLNGEARVVRGQDALLPVSVWLRATLHLNGTKVACGTGDCGACTVLVATPPSEPDATAQWHPLNSCVRFVFQLHGCHVVTIEGLSGAEALAPAQRCLMACHASQCGFCTPGFALTITATLEHGALPVNWRDALAGNVCRCTGYSAILEAAEQTVTLVQSEGIDHWLNTRFPRHSWQPEARALYHHQTLAIAGHDRSPERAPALYRPATVEDALDRLAHEPHAQIVAGATDIGVEGLDATRPVLCIEHLAELTEWSVASPSDTSEHGTAGHTLTLGALVRWQDLPGIFSQTAGVHAASLSALVARVGGPQIRAAGTVGGNIMTASPIGDLLPLLLVLEARVELRSARETRVIPLREFANGYRTTIRRSDELLTRVFVTLPLANEQLRLEKVSRRYEVDIATVSLAARWRDDEGILRDVQLAVGGMGPAAGRLVRAEAVLNGAANAAESWATAAATCVQDVTPRNDVRGSAAYRSLVLQTLITHLSRSPEGAA